MKDTVDIDIRVRYAETDQMGVAYYANYFVWFEVGRTEFCRKRGFRYADLENQGYILVVTETYCKYRSSARYDETIVVRTGLRKLNRRMVIFTYNILRKENGELIAEGETKHICLDSSGKVRSLPEKFLNCLAGKI
jgi:acyl-CoA thioester hydrolase